MLRFKPISTMAALAICLAVPATSVTTAQATTPAPVDLRSPDSQERAREAAAAQVDLRSPDSQERAREAAAAQVDLRSPDSQERAREAAAAQVDLRSPDTRDAARTTATAPVKVIERPVGAGFQWGDAGIGAAGTLALMLLVACLGMVAGQRRRTGRATAPSH